MSRHLIKPILQIICASRAEEAKAVAIAHGSYRIRC